MTQDESNDLIEVANQERGQVLEAISVNESGRDFFISYSTHDSEWAEWIAWWVEAAGYSVIMQEWDILPGQDWGLRMQEAARTSDRTIALLSEDYLQSAQCKSEWSAAFREDAAGDRRDLIPVRVKSCEPKGILGGRVYIDLVNITDAHMAVIELLMGLFARRKKARHEPDFPAVAEMEEA